MLERADTAEAIGLNQRASALLDQFSYQSHGMHERNLRNLWRIVQETD